MIRFGAMNSPIRPLMTEIEEIGAMGFDYLELTLDAPLAHYTLVLRQIDAVRRTLGDHGLGLVCHMPTFVNIADLTDGLQQAAMDEMRRSLDTAAKLEAEKVVLHPPGIMGLGALVPDLARTRGHDALEIVLQTARQMGLRICLENMFPYYGAFVEPHDFDTLLQRHRQLALTLDSGHANIGHGSAGRAITFIRRHGNRIGHVHISDNQGQRDEHLPVGGGNIDFKNLIAALSDAGYKETITLEIFGDDRQDLVDSREKLARLIRS